MKIAKVFIGFVIIVLFTLFATANIEEVHVNFLSKSQSMLGYDKQEEPKTIPLFVVIYVSFGAGFIVAWFLGGTLVRMHKRNLKKLQKQYDVLLKETEQLRNLPVNTREEESHRNTDDLKPEQEKK